jgi:DNA polymerase
MGADEAIGDAPVDCFAAPVPEAAAPAAREARSKATPASSRPPLRGTGAGHAAAREAATLAELEAMVAGFDGCALKRTAKSLCFARGRDDARLMLIGEAPGRDEDLQGKPFVGRAGLLLDRMLAAIGLAEEHVYITNTVYWRPPGNRTPTPEEVEACAPFLARQIELVSPEILVLLGKIAVEAIVPGSRGIKRVRGKWLTYSYAGREIPMLATFHPSYLLRTPEDKGLAWHDLLMLKERLVTLP